MTETLFALGAGAQVVGVTGYCIFPRGEIDRLPRVGGTKNPDLAAIAALRPDLIHMNREENLPSHAEELSFTRIFLSEPKRVDDVDALFAALGRLHGVPDRARLLQQRLRELREASSRRSFSFAVPIWKKPWMWCGGDTYVSNLVVEAGGSNVLASRERYPEIALEDVLSLRPDVVFLPDEPWRFNEADAETLRSHGVRVIGPFPGHLFTWHGARTIEGLGFLRTETGKLG